MKLFRFILALATSAGLVPASALAKEPTKENQWAQCLWATVPQSAITWLSLPPSAEKYSGDKTPSQLLEFRLQAACFGKLTPEGKKFPIGFDARKVRLALEAAKPSTIGADSVDPKAFQCKRYFLNDTDMKNPAALKWGFGDFDNGHAFSSITYMFAQKGGGGVGLPETGGLRKCQWINSDGALTDA